MRLNRQLVLFFFLNVLCHSVFSQKQTKPIQVLNKEIVFNNNVSATEYEFPKDIYWTYYDTTKNLLTILTRQVNKGEFAYKNKGELLVYDLFENKIKWQMPFNFMKMTVTQSDSFLLVKKNYVNHQINTTTGVETGWVSKYNLRLINNKSKIGLFECCYNKDSNSLVLIGISLKNGKEIWKKKVYVKYGWSEVIEQNDSTYLFNLDGIRSINILNGKGWYYSGIVGDENYKTTNILNGVGIVFGLMTGMLFYTVGADIVYGIHSNIYIDSTGIYFAAKNKMYCIDKKGFIKWQKDLPLDIMSRSLITVNDSILRLVNLGIAINNGNTVKYGQPFVSKYNIYDGNEISFNIIDVKKNKSKEANSFYSFQDSFLIIKNQELEKHSFSTNIPVKSIKLEKDNKENMVKVVDNKLNYIKFNQKFISFYELDSTKFNILTDSSNIFQFNSELNLTMRYGKNEYYKLFCLCKDVTLLLSENNMVIVNTNGELISEVDISKPIMSNSKYLLSVYRNKILKYDLDNIFKNDRK